MSNIKNIDSKTLNEWLKENKVLLLDVREQEEYNIGKIPNSVNIPLSQISLEHIEEKFPEYQNTKVVMQCRSGIRSMTACEKLEEESSLLELYNLEGGILSWKNQGYDVL